ncbi:MAG: HD domain-containing protein [Bacteroidota bacterium]
MEDSVLEEILERVIVFADQAHGEQKRKYANERYINHPLRVMATCRQYTSDVTILSAALLHDVLEDTATTKKQIADFLSGFMTKTQVIKTVKIVEELTDIYIKATFPDLKRKIRKIKEAERLALVSPEAQMIKYADIIDNTDVTFQDPDFAIVFIPECRMILGKTTKGNQELYHRAINIVEKCQQLLQDRKALQVQSPL